MSQLTATDNLADSTKRELSREDTLRFFNGDKFATDTFLNKYAVTGPDGTLEEYLPEQMWQRMAKAAASVEQNVDHWERRFLDVLNDWKAVPQGSIMFALGNPYQKSSCSNCFVIPIHEDSLEGIFDAAKEMAQTYAYRGGVGIDITPLRPDGAVVSNAARTSTGAWSYMDFYSYITRLIGQHGRRGALMLTIGDSHPDLLNFITAKTDLTKVTGANISLKISDAFMRALENDQSWTMDFSTSHEVITKQLPASEIWDLIIKCATETAEPGILFWDTIKKESPADCYADEGFETICTNPCAEIPLPAYDACTLLSMNLTKYVNNAFAENAEFDFSRFAEDVAVAVRFLDNVKEIDLNLMPLEKQREVAAKGRRIGMGTNGLGDTLANLGLKYDTDEAIEFVDKLYEFFAKTVYGASADLAKEKGAFPIFDAEKEKDNPFLNRIGMAGVPRRNIAALTCAPTGSLSTLCQTSSGVEPVFRNAYIRRRKINHNESSTVPPENLYKDAVGDLWEVYAVIHHNVNHFAKEALGVDLFESSQHEERKKAFESIEDQLPDYFVESDTIDWEMRVRIQATMQKWIDHAISSTCNLPKGTPVETVKKVYEAAYKAGCKGFTVYVDGCRDGVLVTEDENSEPTAIEKTQAPKRPKDMEADVYHVSKAGTGYFVMVGLLDGEPYEVFAGKNGFIPKSVKKAVVTKVKRGQYRAVLDNGEVIENLGEHITDEEAAITRLMSLSLRHGADIKYCVDVLQRVPGDMNNFARVMSRAIKHYIPDGTVNTSMSEDGKTWIHEEGCVRCLETGETKCM
jgi:ribonucleoside-diphosphate reductase alpha chain